MSTLTANDLMAMRDEFEQRAATILGKMLFAFSRLDMNLGLMIGRLRSVGNEAQVKNGDTMNFNAKLEFVAKYVEDSSSLEPAARVEITEWVAAAHDARVQRNQFIHGRWASDVLRSKALNIIGLPGSDAQTTIEYTLDELDAYNHRIQELTLALSRVRERWQLP